MSEYQFTPDRLERIRKAQEVLAVAELLEPQQELRRNVASAPPTVRSEAAYEEASHDATRTREQALSRPLHESPAIEKEQQSVPDIIWVDGQPQDLSMVKDAMLRGRYVAERRAEGSQVIYEQPEVHQEVADHTKREKYWLGEPAVEQQSVSRSSRLKELAEKVSAKKSVRISAGVMAAVAIGGGVAMNYLPYGDDNASDTSNVEVPQLSLETIQLPGECLDENGSGNVLFSGDVSLQSEVQWLYKSEDGSKVHPLMIQNLDEKTGQPGQPHYPALTVEYAPVNYAACIAEEKGVVSVKNNIVTINRDAISPQMTITHNAANAPTLEAVTLDASSNLPEEAVKTLNENSKNKVNASIAVALAHLQASELLSQANNAYDTKIDAAFDDKLTEVVNGQAASFFKNQGAEDAAFDVQFIGEYDKTDYQGLVPAESDHVRVINTSISGFTASSEK